MGNYHTKVRVPRRQEESKIILTRKKQLECIGYKSTVILFDLALAASESL